MNIQEIRSKYPEYNVLSDNELADRLYNKFYAGKIDRQEFNKRVGLSEIAQTRQEPQRTAGDVVSGALQSIGQGATLNLADEAQALIAASYAYGASKALGLDIDFSDAYQDALDDLQEEIKTFRNLNPKTALALEIAGGLSTGGAIAGGLKGSTAIGRIGASIAAGAGTGAIAGAGNIESENLSDRIVGAGAGAFTGALFGGGISGINEIGRKLISKAGQRVSSMVAGQIEADDVIPMFKGERLQDPAAQNIQQRAIAGNLGEKAQDIALQARSVQNNKILSAINKISGKSDDISPVQAINRAANIIEKKAFNMKKVIDTAYTEARDLSKNVFFDKKTFGRGMTSELIPAIRADGSAFSLNRMPDAKVFFNEFVKMARGKGIVKYEKLEDIRSAITKASSQAFKQGRDKEAVLLSKMRDSYDNYMAIAVDTALRNGDDAAINAFKTAISKRAEFGKLFERNTIVKQIASGKTLTGESLTPESKVNMIIGASKVGSKTQAGEVVNALIKAAGDEAETLKSNLGLGTLQRAISKASGVTDPKNPTVSLVQPGRLAAELNDILDNESFTKKVFSEQQIKAIQDLTGQLKLIGDKQAGVANPSGTAEVLLNFARQFSFVNNIPLLAQAAQAMKDAKNTKELQKILGEFGTFIKGTPEIPVSRLAVTAGLIGSKPELLTQEPKEK